MKYSEEIVKYLFEGTEEGWLAWLQNHALLDQVDILNEFKVMISEAMEDIDNKEMAEALKQLEEKTNSYQESILDEQLTLLKLEMVEDDLAKMMKELELRTERLREYILECITGNAPNAEVMKILAVEVIKYEKAVGKYNVQNWLAYNPGI
jgi:predicted transcriptional regulator